MNARQWGRVGTVALAAGVGSLTLAPFGELGLVSQGIAGSFAMGVLGNGLTNRGPFGDGLNAVLNLGSMMGGMIAGPLVAYNYGVVAAAGATAVAAGLGAAVIGCGPIRNWSTGIVRELHQYIRQEDYQ
ncbi:MAG: hypothetical protein HY319_14870 [Armatimonadetes bacterium]|nr:hypothetical protein [Armatimonadota bacterium]